MFWRSVDVCVAIVLVLGGLNWGLIGFFDFNPVAAVFGLGSMAGRILYGFVGLCAVYQAVQFKAIARRWNCALPELFQPSGG